MFATPAGSDPGSSLENGRLPSAGPEQSPNCDRLQFVTDLNTYLNDPEYRVVFFARHAHAVQEGKKVDGQDQFRELDAKGIADAAMLGHSLSGLNFNDVVMVTSSATRTHETAKAIAREISANSIRMVAEDQFYHVPVKNYFKYLRNTEELQDTRHAFIVGHNSAMTKVFLKISGRENAFIPTAGVMALAVKAGSWESFYKGQHQDVHVFTWSPRETHVLESVMSSGEAETEYTSQRVRGAGLWLPAR
jgi:phosphohistidine phosphatase